MIPPPIPSDDVERLAALDRYAILDTSSEPAFDDIAQIAASICKVPIALISLIGATRQWFKASVGLEMRETPRTLSFCGHAIHSGEFFTVEDTHADGRFADNPLVTGAPFIRFYAGVPLTTPDGHRLGTLCVIDRVPRTLNEEQIIALHALARQVMVQLELRKHVAERTAAERELDRFFDVSLDLLCIAGFDGHFKRLNPAFESVLGYTLDELISVPFVDLIHPDDRPATLGEMDGLRRGMKTIYFENRYVRKDGGIRWIAWTATPIIEEGLIYAAGRDITRTKIAEQELRLSESRTRAIIDNALGSLITTDKRGVIETVNPAAQRMFDYTAEELIGRKVCVLLERVYDSDEQCLEHLREAALGRVTEWRGRKKNGECFTCELSLFEFYTDDQRHFAAHMLDISERQEVERMKKDFISTVSHELRTPLTSIRGSLGLLAGGVVGELSAEARQVVSVAERNSLRLIALINDILDFDKLESGRMEMNIRPTPLLRVLEHSIESISAMAAQEGVQIDLDCGEAMVQADEVRIAQVTTNLLSNAVKYSPRGGTVIVRAIGGEDCVEVRVEDSGPGIEPSLQNKLFRRFEQADSGDARAKAGTGLGLAICKAIIELHGGTIGVESAAGAGSKFWFRLPGNVIPSERVIPSEVEGSPSAGDPSTALGMTRKWGLA